MKERETDNGNNNKMFMSRKLYLMTKIPGYIAQWTPYRLGKFQ